VQLTADLYQAFGLKRSNGVTYDQGVENWANDLATPPSKVKLRAALRGVIA
jgi:hypothetical protein